MRGSYLPKTWQGVVIHLVYLTFLIVVLVDAFETQDTVLRTVLFIFPQWVAAIVVTTWIAAQHS